MRVNENELKKYEDIINLPHHVSKTRNHMSLIDRAAQFSPFAAVAGHDHAIHETARLTASKHELDDMEKELLDEKLRMIEEILKNSAKNQLAVDPLVPILEIEITYFVKDLFKEGGEYITYTGIIKKIDTYDESLIFEDGKRIFICDILGVSGEIFLKLGLNE